MVSTVVQLALLLCVTFQTPPTWPPEPNFERPVDYFAWYESWVAGADGLEGNAYADYLRICPELATFDPLKMRAEDPDVFPNIAGPMADEYGEPVAWSLGDNPRWMAAAATNAKHMDAFAKAARKPFALTSVARLAEAKRYGIVLHATFGVHAYTGPLMKARWAFLHSMWCRDGEYVNEPKFLNGIETLLEFARQLDRAGDGLSAMMNVRLRGDVVRSVESALEMGILGRASRAKLLATLTRLRPKDDRYCLTVVYDCALAYDESQRLALAKRAGEDADRAKIAAELARVAYDAERLSRELREYYAQILPLTKLPVANAKLDKLTKLHQEVRSRPFFEHHELVDPASGLQAIAKSAMRYDGLRLVVALHVYRDMNGEWPETLDLLVKSKMVESKIDPLNGEPFVYRVEGRQPLLYSIGADAKDESGKHNSRAGIKHKEPIQPGDYVIWPLERRGKQ